MHTRISRRAFAQSGLVATAAGLLSPTARAANAEDPFHGLPIGVQSYSLRKFEVEQAIRHVQGLGVKKIEFYSKHLPLDASKRQLKRMGERLEKAGLSISAHGVNQFTADHAANRRVFEFARAAGIRNITANPLPDSFASLDKLVDEFDIRIAIHNHGPGALYDKLSSVQKAVEGRHKLIGACIDTGHTLRSNGDPVKWIRELGDRVFALHLKDVAEKQKRTHDVVIGSGHLDVEGVFTALRQIKFPRDGSLSLEYESNPDNPLDDMEQCFDVARKVIRKVYG